MSGNTIKRAVSDPSTLPQSPEPTFRMFRVGQALEKAQKARVALAGRGDFVCDFCFRERGVLAAYPHPLP